MKTITLPSRSESTIMVKSGDKTVNLELFDFKMIQEECNTKIKNLGVEFESDTYLVLLQEALTLKYELELSKQAIVALLEVCNELSDDLKKKYSPSSDSQGSTKPAPKSKSKAKRTQSGSKKS